MIAAALLFLSAVGGAVYYYRGGLPALPLGAGSGANLKGFAKRVESKPMLYVQIGNKIQGLSAEELGGGISIGRGAEADVNVAHTKLSRVHAKMRLIDRKLQFQDAGSTNGSTLDGERLAANQPVQINTSSKIALGGVDLVISRDKP